MSQSVNSNFAARSAQRYLTVSQGNLWTSIERLSPGLRITLHDIAEYATRCGDPVRFTYRGREMITEPASTKDGLILAYNLNVL
jgi:gamma-glutamyltranspeptidase